MSQGLEKMMFVAMRKPEGITSKMREMPAIGDSAQSPAVPKHASSPEKIWDSVEECDAALKSFPCPWDTASAPSTRCCRITGSPTCTPS